MRTKKLMLQWTCTALAGLLLLSGCGQTTVGPGEPTPSAPTSTNTQTATPEPTPEPPTELSIVMYERWAGVGYDNPLTQLIQERTNTRLKITAIAGGDLENKLNIMLASGDRPDIIQFGLDDTEWKYSRSGVLLALDEYFDKAPNLQAFGNDGTWDAMRHEDGHIYAAPIKGSIIDNIPLYRKDWLDNLGLKVPSTIDEFITVAEAFSNNDPDGNGKKDTYALGGFTLANGFDLASWDHVFGAFGTLPNYWVEWDGRIMNGSVTPGALEALKVLNRLYKNKAIDMEFLTDNSSRFKEKLIQGIIGAPVYRTFILDPNNINNYYEPMKQHNPEAEFVQGTILKGTDRAIGFRTLTQRGWQKTAVLKESKHADAAIRLLDYLASEEGNMLVNYGEEGTDYTLENGMVTRLITDEDMKKRGVDQFRLTFNQLYKHTSLQFQEIREYAVSISYPSPVDGIFIEGDTKLSELDGFASVKFSEMITAEGPIDEMFNAFVAEWNKRGGEALTQAYNEAYQKRKAGR